MEKEDSIDKLNKQIKELQEDKEENNDILEESINEEDNNINEDITKEFTEEEIEEIEEQTKEFTEEEIEEKKEEEKTIEKKEIDPPEIKDNKKQKNHKKGIIITLVILILIAISIITIVIIKMNKKTTIEEEPENKYTPANLKKILNNYGESIENVISINLENKKELLTYEEAAELVDFPNSIVCKTNEVYEDGKIYLDQCNIDGYKTNSKYGEKQEEKEEVAEVIEDGSFYVYEKNKTATLEPPKEEEKDEYQKYLVTPETKPKELELLSTYNAKYVFYYDEDYNVHMKNFRTNKDAVVLQGVQSVLPIKNKNGYDTTYVGILYGKNWGIYNLNTGLLEVKSIYKNLTPYLYMGTSGPSKMIESLTDENIAAIDYEGNIGVINYKTGETIIPFDTNGMQRSGNYLWKYNYSYNEKTQTSEYTDKAIYDFDGNKYLENKYDELYGIVDGKYILVRDNKNIKMVLIDGKLLYDYKEIDNLGKINYFIEYNQNPLFQFNKITTEDTDENKCIEISYDTKTKKGTYKDYYCGGIAKPILYLYPTEQTNVKITFEHPDLLKTTYPKYNKEWNVTVKEDGTITDKDGRNYYALYWDEKQKNKVDFKYGYYVTSNKAIKFLEQKLFEIGLTEREANEFIMYWLPKLENNKKSLVYFELTEEKEKYNKINIEPKPDSLLRLTIHIKKVNKETKIKEQKIKPFVRNGFTAVEWGGVEY